MWFAVSVLLKRESSQEGNSEGLWEENIVLVQAESEALALIKAEELGKDMEVTFEVASGATNSWRYDGVLSCYELLDDEPLDGTTVFARHLRDSEVQSLRQKFD